MPTGAVTLERATEEQLGDVEALLEANGLPSADVRANPDCFYVAYAGGDSVGIVGLEVHDSVGLLRSLVVRERVRGDGYGEAIRVRVEALAREAGVDELYLLTTTAAPFFAGRGYEHVDRADAPATLRESAEFADLCPDGASCMRKPL